MGLSEQQLACVKADELVYQFLEYLKYYHPLPFPENEWNDPKNKVTFGIRLALGQYYQKGACAAGIKFSDFVQCLSALSNKYGTSLQSIDNDIRVVEQELITLLRELEANDDMGISALLELLGAK